MAVNTMKQKLPLIRLGLYSAVTLVFSAIAIASAVIVLQRDRTDASPPAKPAVGASVPSQFSFGGATGWWQGATNETSIAIFPNAQDCFVSVQHITGSLAAKQAKDQAALASLTGQGHITSKLGTQSLSITTNTGVKQYQLQWISVSSPNGASASTESQVEGGQENAYVPLSSNDFLYVEGYCDTPTELPTTLPVLQAVKFSDAG